MPYLWMAESILVAFQSKQQGMRLTELGRGREGRRKGRRGSLGKGSHV